MKQLFIFSLLLFLSLPPILMYSQENLIKNGSFENGSRTPRNTYGDYPDYKDFDSDVDYWNAAHYNNPCNTIHFPLTPKKYYIYCSSPIWRDRTSTDLYTTTCDKSNPPWPSNRYVALFFDREGQCRHWTGIRTSLFKGNSAYTLISGQSYTIKMKLRAAIKPEEITSDGNHHIRVHFAKFSDNWNATTSNNQRIIDAATFIINIPQKTRCKWYQVESTFRVPDDGEHDELKNIILFMEDGAFDVDDVELYETCPNIQRIENYTYNNLFLGNPFKYEAAKTLKAGYDVGASTPNGDVIVESDADVTYKAGEEISLEDGFEVKEGGEFYAFIAPCGSDCFAPVANTGQDATVCNQNCYQIGAVAEYGFTYNWVAEPSSAISYLSAANISNPFFCPPSNSNGTIKYILTVSNNCGQQTTDEVVINYDSNPSSTPTISLSNVKTDDYTVSFDATVGTHTEAVMIEVYNWNQSTLYYAESLERGFGFNCCNFSWTTPEIFLSVCQNYKIKVSSKNMCGSNEATQTIDWIRNKNLSINTFPNIFTPNGDGVNDELCIDVTGVDNYIINVVDADGYLVYQGSGNVYSNPVCVWDGTCNTTFCGSSCVNPGNTYRVDINFYSCGTAQYSGRLVYVTSPIACSGKKENTYNESDIAFSQDTITPPLSRMEYSLHPNPNTGNFTLTMQDEEFFEKNAKVKIYDLLGREVYQSAILNQVSEINLSSQRQGVYVVKVELDNQVWIEKMVVN